MGGLSWILLAVGAVGSTLAAVLDPGGARAAADQDWSPFVLVGGLLLVGLAAQRDCVFAAAGAWLDKRFPDDRILFAAAGVLVGIVSATLNLDTSVAFLTPVFVYAGRRRPAAAAALLYGCLLLSNAGSLLLPGSNLTNLIVLGTLHLSGLRFLTRMALPWGAALLVTAVVVIAMERPRRAGAACVVSQDDPPPMELPSEDTATAPARARVGLGLAGVVAAVALVLVLRSAALEVAGVGLTVTGARLISRRLSLAEALDVLDLPVLIGLLGVAVAIGTLGRAWNGPSVILGHLGEATAAAVAAVASVILNNLPAASLLGAGGLRHPFAVLIGLDLGPNLFATGSLAWFLWLRAAGRSGAKPSIARATRLGVVAVPLSMAAALLALSVTG